MVTYLRTAWGLFQGLWYWVPAGVLLGELVRTKLSAAWIERSVRKHGLRSLLAASVAGAALPLCACGVIPFLVTFLALGVPLPPILAFTAASPIMDPADMVLTFGVLGWRFALFTLLAAFALGVGTGWLYIRLRARGCVEDGPRVRATRSPTASNATKRGFWPWVRRVGGQMWFVGRYLLLAILVGALLQGSVPPGVVQAALGGRNWFAIPAGVVLGLVTYGISSVPSAKILLEMGASPGAVMAFFLAGHATSIGLLTALATLVRKRTFFLYLGNTIAVSLVFGVLFQMLS